LDNVSNLVARALPVTKYPGGLKPAWKEDVDQVVQGVAWTRERLLEMTRSCEILAIEETLSYRLRSRRLPIVLRAKVDLVVRHRDGTLEVVDFKSGKSLKENAIQQLLSRIVVVAKFGKHERVITTTIHTALRRVTSRELKKSECVPTWKAILVAVDGIQSDGREPIPSALCDWCPYFDRCPAHAVQGSVDELTAYLEDVADAADDEQPAA
jgi:CRISPR/Cas system-associated exonuclease Cas4 (RecB family)